MRSCTRRAWRSVSPTSRACAISRAFWGRESSGSSAYRSNGAAAPARRSAQWRCLRTRAGRPWRVVMKGWRARLGFLIPPGNPTIEPEMIAMAPTGVSVHFSRLVAHGATGSHHGQEERNRTMVEHAGESAGLLAMVKPNVIMLAHTATSYTLGPQNEAELLARLSERCGTIVETAFASVL